MSITETLKAQQKNRPKKNPEGIASGRITGIEVISKLNEENQIEFGVDVDGILGKIEAGGPQSKFRTGISLDPQVTSNRGYNKFTTIALNFDLVSEDQLNNGPCDMNEITEKIGSLVGMDVVFGYTVRHFAANRKSRTNRRFLKSAKKLDKMDGVMRAEVIDPFTVKPAPKES